MKKISTKHNVTVHTQNRQVMTYVINYMIKNKITVNK